MPDPTPRLRLPIRLKMVQEAIGLGALTPGERRQFAGVPGSRRDAWLRGRHALKELLHGADTSTIRFPHPRVSISHCGSWAVAARSWFSGTGVDLQLDRGPSPRTARLFLTRSERARGPPDLMRLWTVKEALFKADTDNAGSWLSLYETEHPGRPRGRAVRTDTGRRFEYSSIEIGNGWLTVAITGRQV